MLKNLTSSKSNYKNNKNINKQVDTEKFPKLYHKVSIFTGRKIMEAIHLFIRIKKKHAGK